MDTDSLFSFLNENIRNNRIKREYTVLDYVFGMEISRSNILIKKTKVKSVVVKFILGNNFNLLVEDLPINFLLSHTIIIGDKTELKIFRFRDEKEVLYVAEKSLMDKLIERVDLNSISNYIPRKLKGVRYHLNYNLPDIILKLKDYNKKVRKIDLEAIHIVQGNIVSNFVPSLNRLHLKIASRLEIELASLINNGVIRDSNINFFDEESQIKHISPFFIFEKEIYVKLNKKRKERIYSDFSYEIFFYPNPENSRDKIDFAKQVSTNKEKLITNLQSIRKIRLSSINGKEIIPLWLVGKDNFLAIKNKKEFLDITGINFEMEKNIEAFNDLFLQSLDGKKAIFCKNYLNPNYEEIFESNFVENIFYKNLNALTLKLNMSKSNIVSIILEENISKEKIIEVEMAIRKLLHLTITQSVKFNKLPFENVVKNTLLKYYASVASSIYSNFNEYNNFMSKKNLIDKTLVDTRRILKTVEIENIEFDYLFELNNCILALIDILSVFDLDKSKNFKILFNDYFQTPKAKEYAKRDISIESLVESIVFANILAKKYNLKVILKKEFDTNLFSEDIIFLTEKPSIKKYTVRPRINVLKNIFPYSYLDAVNQIKTLPFHVIKYSSMSIKGKIFPIKDEFYELFCEYEENYFEVFSNEYFIILRKKS